MYIVCSIKGVQIGKSSRFYGRTIIYRSPNSKIIIGPSCGFRSNQLSNHIGINRPCRICTLMPEARVKIGTNCGFSGTVIGSFKKIEIGDNVLCGANTLITDGDWHINDKRAGISKEVVIEDNVWLGEGVKVLKGVRIGENSLIGAGSVVTKDIPPNVIAAGNPCKVVRQI